MRVSHEIKKFIIKYVTFKHDFKDFKEACESRQLKRTICKIYNSPLNSAHLSDKNTNSEKTTTRSRFLILYL